MKQRRIFFVNYGREFDKTEELIIKLLSRKYEVIVTPDCDYLFYGCDGYKHLESKYLRCVKIFYTMENLLPDFNFCDYALSHSHLQFGDRHYRMQHNGQRTTPARLMMKKIAKRSVLRSRLLSFFMNK